MVMLYNFLFSLRLWIWQTAKKEYREMRKFPILHRKEEVELFLPGSAWQLWRLSQTPPWRPPCSWQSTRGRQRRWSSDHSDRCGCPYCCRRGWRGHLATSGDHFSEIFSNDSGESTEKHMRITSIVICPWIGSREVKNLCVFGPFC